MSDKLSYSSGRITSVLNLICVVSLSVLAAANCGPELTEPAETDVSGRWTSSDVVGALSNLSIDLVQRSDGVVEGQWSAIASSPNPVCPPELDSAPTGPVTGSNTVLELRLAFLGAGDFSGQARDDTLTGSLVSCEALYLITFLRASPGQ